MKILFNGKECEIIAARIYGAFGHRQAMAFEKSEIWNFSDDNNVRFMAWLNNDFTNCENAYTLGVVIKKTKDECIKELRGQVSDGYFENARCHKIDYVNTDELRNIAELFKDWGRFYEINIVL